MNWLPCLSVMIVLSIGGAVQASGYHPPFDRAVAEAEIIVLGEVSRAWSPKVISRKGPGLAAPGGRIYRMEVKKVYKGPVARGQKIHFMDPHHASTASYRVTEDADNLTFLVKAELTDFERRRFDFGVQDLFRPIRNLSEKSHTGGSSLDGWLYLLDRLVENQAADPAGLFRDILRHHTNRDVLHYAVTHWPKNMLPTDIDLLKTVAEKYASDAYVASYAVQKLHMHKVKLDARLLRKLLVEGSKYMREELLAMVDSSNVAAVQDLLFGFLLRDRPEAEQKLVEVLAAFAPEFLKAQLESRDLPAWKLIPCLQELRISASAVGKNDFSPQILATSPYTLRKLGEIIGGDEFHGVLALCDPEGYKEWEHLFPLLMPLLQGGDTPIRKLVVALMRTFGKQLQRSGQAYRIVGTERPEAAPVHLAISTPKTRYRLDEPVLASITETITAYDVWLAFEGPLGWHSMRPDSSTTTSGGFFHVFKDVDLPRGEYAQCRKGQARTSERNITSYFDMPGIYRIRAKKLYPHDGGSHGIDAWTGLVHSASIEIEIVE